MKFSEAQTKFLTDNYATMGSLKCSEILRLPLCSVKNKAHALKLKIDKNTHSQIKKKAFYKKPEDYPVKVSEFYNITKPEIAYILGVIWGDGYISRNSVELQCVADDGWQYYPIFRATGEWNIRTGKRKNQNWREFTIIHTHNEHLVNFLKDYGYGVKSSSSPIKILEHIPEHIRRYFLLGWLDADGCFYYGKRRQLTVYGSYEQDWTAIENMYTAIGATYNINRLINTKGHKSSNVRVTNKTSIYNIGHEIYRSIESDNIGLLRKYHKWNSMCVNQNKNI